MVVSYRLYGSENQYVCSEILLHTHTNIYIRVTPMNSQQYCSQSGCGIAQKTLPLDEELQSINDC